VALSLYNKYRPQTFKDVVGQDHVETTLANGVDKQTVSHAYLFCGPRGTGKTTTARILAKALLCEKAPTSTPDGSCEQCREISEGIHPDVYELDAASRTGVDNVREEIIGRVNFAPTHGSHKIYIIDEVHMLSTPAFNALLKTLEEPPPHVVFVLCTTDVHKVPDTVQARCQRFDFRRLAAAEIVGRLRYICEREGFDAEPAALELIAQRSQGGMRDAIRSLEQVAVFSGGKLSYTAAESLLGMVDAEALFGLCNELAAGNVAACFDWVAGYVQSGSDIAILVHDLAAHVRNLYAVSVVGGAQSGTAQGKTQGTEEQLANALEIDAATLPRLREQAASFNSPDRLAWILSRLGALSAELKNAANARLALEVTLTRILRPESEMSLEALAARVAALEAQLESMALPPSARREPGPAAPRAGATAAGGAGFAGAAAGAAGAASAAAGAAANAAAGPDAASAQPLTPVNGEPADEPTGTQPAEALQQAFVRPEPSSPPEQHRANETTPEAGDYSSLTSDDEQELYRRWNSVIDIIKKEKRGVAASLGGITPQLSSDGKRLTLQMPAQAATSLQYLETEANKSLLNKTVAQVFGKPLTVVLADAYEPASSVAAPEPEIFDEDKPALAADSAAQTASAEPSKEELDAILATSFNGAIHFEE
jgi:DNA polymerase-3 subunit gamma/tau